MIDDEYLKVGKSQIEGMKVIDPLKENVSFYGAPWIKTNKNYERLDINDEKNIKEASVKCYNLGKCSSGIQLHFRTNSKKLIIHATVPNTAGLSGMTWVAQAGFDCYVGTSYDDLKFIDTSRCYPIAKTYEYTFFKDLPGDKLVVINFPLYNKVESMYLLIEDDAYIMPVDEIKEKIVFYGTSITQGGCASRPGLCYTNILSRRLKKEIVNLGFSGNAFGEAYFAKIMTKIKDVRMYVINYEANAGVNGKLEATMEEFIKTIRKYDKDTPIVVASRIKYIFDDLLPDTLGKNRERIRLFQENLIKRLSENDNNLYYVDGSKILGEKYDELTIDAIHPNDLGFMVIADELEKIIKEILNKTK